jgi:hypothetical protein
MIDKIKQLIQDMNSKGIPIPLARDPKTGRGSLTFTMPVVSFGICVVLLAGKAADKLGGIDYDNALWLLGLTLSTYLGRQYQKNGKQFTLGDKVKSGDSDDKGDLNA